MVENNSLDHLITPDYEETGPVGTLFENGAALDIHQKHATPNRMSVELGQALRQVDEQRQQELAQTREMTPTIYDHMLGCGAWVTTLREKAVNPVQPVTAQEFIGEQHEGYGLAA